jgi:hypothetical protein
VFYTLQSTNITACETGRTVTIQVLLTIKVWNSPKINQEINDLVTEKEQRASLLNAYFNKMYLLFHLAFLK